MHALLAVGVATAVTDSGPPVTELVPVRVRGSDPSWPPVLVVCVAAVVLGGLFVAVLFLRRAWSASHSARRTLDG